MSYKPGMYQHPGYATLVAEQEAIQQDLQQLETERKQAMSDREKFERRARELLALNAMQGTTLGIVAIADTIEKAVAEKQAEIDRLKAELERVNTQSEAFRIQLNEAIGNLERTEFDRDTIRSELEKAQDTIKGYEHTEASGNVLTDALLDERDRLKAKMEWLVGERDTWRKRFEAQPSTYQLATVEQERDTLREELKAERRGWPIDQPLTDMPMERQINLLNQQLIEQQVEREAADTLAKMVAVCEHCGSYTFASRSCSLCLTKERDILQVQLEAMTENRDHFCHHINLIAKELGTDKDNSAPEAVLRWVRTQKAQLEEALALIAAKAKVFRSYEALHLAKLTDAGMLKAKENRNHASDLEAFIQQAKQTS